MCNFPTNLLIFALYLYDKVFVMKNLIYILVAAFVALLFQPVTAQNQSSEKQAIEFSKKVHNFGKISVNDGIKHCTFEFRNTSDKPVVINNIITSCGCTEPKWPKKPIMPGEGGKVEVTYLNDQGPYPFDKSLTVYTSASTKPIILRISGLAYENERSIKEMFPVSIGPLGVKKDMVRAGQIAQGNMKGGNFQVANTSNKSVTVKFADVTPGLEISIEPQTIPAGGMADVSYTINTEAKKNWGATTYTANVVCNGVKAAQPIKVECMIIDNFSRLSKEERAKGSMVIAVNSSFNFGTVSKGEPVTATFQLRNTGQSPLVLHKIDAPSNVKVSSPTTIAAGEKFTFTAKVDTSAGKGEEITTITLITNSPNRPLVNLFVTGTVQ